jgi:RimJ/RimL family protein N-acetyltransferase
MVELQLRGEGLVLRRPRPADAPAMAEAVRESQPEIGRFLVWATPDYATADAEQWCRSVEQTDPGTHPLHVFDQTGQLLGGVGLHSQDLRNGKIELGYWTRARARGRGVAVRASRLLTDCAFDAMGFARVELIIALDNVASQRVADKLGARREGILHDRLRLTHGLVDAHLYALLRRDVRPR